MKFEFSRRIFEKNAQIWSFMKILPVGSVLFRTDGHDETNIRFSKFCERL